MCRGPGREDTHRSSIESVSKWLKKNKTEPKMMSIIVRYLYARNTATMTSFTRPRTSLRLAYLANLQDRLGFQNFVEGKICNYLVEIQPIHLEASGTWHTADLWASELIAQLLIRNHRQWLHRNAFVHYKLPGGRTLAQNASTTARVQDLIWEDPENLLEEDRWLLREDFFRAWKIQRNRQGMLDCGNGGCQVRIAHKATAKRHTNAQPSG